MFVARQCAFACKLRQERYVDIPLLTELKDQQEASSYKHPVPNGTP